MAFKESSILLLASLSFVSGACIPSGDQTAINNLFSSGGEGIIVQLCASATITVSGPITFTASNQEISTEGYPTGDTRAIIQPASGTNTTTMITGYGYDYLRILNIQLDGLRPTLGLVEGT